MGLALGLALALSMCPATGIAEEALVVESSCEDETVVVEQDDGSASTLVEQTAGDGEAIVVEQTDEGALELQPQAEAVPYCAWNENDTKVAEVPGGCTDYVLVDGSTATTFENGKFYVVVGKATVGSRITVEAGGTAHLILCDGAKLIASAGITTTGATLTIYGQTKGTGELEANGGSQNQATITVQCLNEDCDVTDGLTLTISALTSLTYDGTAKAATLSTGYSTIAFPDSYSIKYVKEGQEVAAAKDAGTYTARQIRQSDGASCSQSTYGWMVLRRRYRSDETRALEALREGVAQDSVVAGHGFISWIDVNANKDVVQIMHNLARSMVFLMRAAAEGR